MIDQIDNYLGRLFPISRSITGDGNRETLKTLQEIVPLRITEYSAGEKVYDWTIPDEWNPKEAWLKLSDGTKIADFSECNVHLVGYSQPINRFMSFDELRSHLHVHPTIPEAIPYRTSYYNKDWGFCVTRSQFESLASEKNDIHVLIDADIDSDGGLTIGDLVIEGTSAQEILISTYICHPSLANDNLSGLLLSAFLAKYILENISNYYTYRFVWVPETIGAIAYCAKNEEIIKNIEIALVVTTVGGPGGFGYKQSIDPNHRLNKLIRRVFEENNIEYVEYPFDINGSDERQYSSQGFGINAASITKDKYYQYDYYHSSKDDLSFVKPNHISESLDLYCQLIQLLDGEVYYRNEVPFCEVMLSKHDLYPAMGGSRLPVGSSLTELDLIRWVLLLSDGSTSTASIAEKLNVNLDTISRISVELNSKRILVKI
jgi:aminopeptidase-like protein